LQATQRFDPYKGVKLSSYAVYWIRAYILKYILDNIRLVRLGKTRAERKLFFRLNKEKRELERLGFEAEPKLLAERLDVSESDITDMEQRLARNDLSLQAPVWSGDDSREVGEILPGRDERRAEVGDAELRRVFMERVRVRADAGRARSPDRMPASGRGAALAAGAGHRVRVRASEPAAGGAHRHAAPGAPEAEPGRLRVLRGVEGVTGARAPARRGARPRAGRRFRAATRSKAEACGVSGWVRNRPDGSVEAPSRGCRSRGAACGSAGGPPVRRRAGRGLRGDA
jgi:hypothetical protein